VSTAPVRPTYHHGRLTQALTAVAVDLAREGGPDAVVLREAARRVGVSATAAYRHFRDRDDLLRAVTEEALHRLAGRMLEEDARLGAALPAQADPATRAVLHFRALGRGYVAFAVTQPGLFRTISRAAPAADVPPAEPFLLLVAALDRLVDLGVLDRAARAGADAVAWAGVHGLSVLVLDGYLPAPEVGARTPGAPDAADPPDLLERMLDVIAYGLLPRPTGGS
jgi:AcrR family transcriptional regulator